MIAGLYKFAESWSKSGSVWIVSDTHFDDVDRSVMRYTISSEEQAEIIKKRISKLDTLIHLGDVGNAGYLSNIPGYKVLLLGNHDDTRKKFEPYFDEIYEGPLMISKKIILSHEPLDINWAFNIHGHDHSADNKGDAFHLNLAANVCGYTPVSLGKLIKSGIVSGIKNIHRITIDKASGRINDSTD